MSPSTAREPRALLWDARRAAGLVEDFVRDHALDDYRDDVLLRSAVERQFEIIGEALNRLSRQSPDLADRIPDLPRLVAFRNILIHGYAVVDDAIVWDAATRRLPGLIRRLDGLLAEH